MNAVFAYLTDEVCVGLDNAKFTYLQNTMTQIPLVALKVFLHGVAMRWLDQAVSALFLCFLKYSLTVSHVAGRFDGRRTCLGSNGGGTSTVAAMMSTMYIY